MSERNRPQLTVQELLDFLNECNPDAVIYVGESLLNIDGPEETQEFIDWENRKKVVAMESTHLSSQCVEVTLGYVVEE